MNKTSFIITTFCRDELLYKSVESLIPFQNENWHIIIIDQGKETKEKTEWLKEIRFNRPDLIHYRKVNFDSGLSYCRNYGVEFATKLECDYCVIGSDSFLFNSSINKLEEIICDMKQLNYDKCGFELEGCKCGWEAKLNLIEGENFELNFIEKKPIDRKYFEVDICRNFYIATTESLLNSPFDNNLKLGEHEDQAWRYKQNGYKSLWTDFISAEKMTDRPNEYANLRKKNFNEGIKYLRKKYNIKGWVSYRHLDRAKS